MLRWHILEAEYFKCFKNSSKFSLFISFNANSYCLSSSISEIFDFLEFVLFTFFYPHCERFRFVCRHLLSCSESVWFRLASDVQKYLRFSFRALPILSHKVLFQCLCVTGENWIFLHGIQFCTLYGHWEVSLITWHLFRKYLRNSNINDNIDV